jgi:hypothetical protein
MQCIVWLWVNSKQILGGENGPLKDYFEGGATWAFDVGSQSMTCPIIVEDLERPRQMLVEVNDSAIVGSFSSYYCQCMHIADGVASVDAL